MTMRLLLLAGFDIKFLRKAADSGKEAALKGRFANIKNQVMNLIRGWVSGLCIAWSLTGINASAGTFVVPTDYATIQQAVTAASLGDVIEVLPGTYTENI